MKKEELKLYVTAEVQKALNKLKQVGNEKKKLTSLSGKLSKTLAPLKSGYLGLTAIILGTVVGIKKMTMKASDLAEANNKFLTTFSGVEASAKSMRDELVKSYGQSKLSATEMLSTTGDMLSGFQFSASGALKLSASVNKLAIDLSSYANVPVAQAAQALTKGLIGERESMKTLGIAILESDVKQRLFEKGQNKLTGVALKQARAQVTLELAMEQSKNAIGDFKKTIGGSLPNQIRDITSMFEDWAVSMGAKLLPTMLKLTKGFRKMFKTGEENKLDDLKDKLEKLSDTQKKYNELLAEKEKLQNQKANASNKKEILAAKKLISANNILLGSAKNQFLEEKKIIAAHKERLASIKNLNKNIASVDAKMAAAKSDAALLETKEGKKELTKRYSQSSEKLAGSSKDEYFYQLKNKPKSLTESRERYVTQLAQYDVIEEANKMQLIAPKKKALPKVETPLPGQTSESDAKKAIAAKQKEIEEKKRLEEELNKFIVEKKEYAIEELTKQKQQHLKTSEAIIKNEVALIQAEKEKGIINEKEYNDKKQAIEQQASENRLKIERRYQQEVAKIEQEALQRQIEGIQKKMGHVQTVVNAGLSIITGATNVAANNEKIKLDKYYDNKLKKINEKTEEELELELAKKEIKTEEEKTYEEYKKEVAALSNEEKLSRAEEIASKSIQLEENVNTAKKARIQKIESLEKAASEAEAKRKEAEVAIEAEKNEKLAALNRKQFKIKKGGDISQAIINTALAVTRALTAGPIIGPIMAAITAASGAAQVGIISARANPYYKGGIAKSPQLATLAEEGKPEIVLPPNLTAMLLDMHSMYNQNNNKMPAGQIINNESSSSTVIEKVEIKTENPEELYSAFRDIGESKKYLMEA